MVTIKKVLAWALCFAFMQGIMAADALAIQLNQPVQPQRVAHLTGLLTKLGSGNQSLIAVRLGDKSAVAGYLARIGRDSFEIIDTKTGEPTTVPYLQVSRLQGLNLTTGVEVHDGVGVRGKLVRAASLLVPHQRVQRNGFLGTTTLIIGIIIGILLAVVLAKVL
jgi:hypothetical protein